MLRQNRQGMKGYDQPLYLLPFDHRGSFQKELMGIGGTPTAEQAAVIRDYKQTIFAGFLAALGEGVPRERAGILVDEEYGAEVARGARDAGVVLAMPAEKSGQAEFELQYGDAFADHIVEFDPDFCKVLVRYNPDGDVELNHRQSARLAELSAWLAPRPNRFMFELLVPATEAQTVSVGGQRGRYDTELRPQLMLRAVGELQDHGVEPDVWKVEGLEQAEDCRTLVAQVRTGGRDAASVIVLGRGDTEAHVERWLEAAAAVPGYVGFAVGRTAWWDALVALRDGRISREAAVESIAGHFTHLVEIWTTHAG
jgi:myo-inositol catabolism protein IolC